ncbi:MAG: hydantoinase/oxoprolinase family protein [Solirubrobacterales bacterium]
MASGATLAVDVGGTFTDAVVATAEGLFTGKTPTTPEDQSIGVIAAADAALAGAGLAATDVAGFVHGMTITTNALLEGRFARTALLATAGFTDVEELARQDRSDLYRLCATRPAPIVPTELRFPVPERCGPDGVIEPLDETATIALLERCREAGVESIAVCLLFSFRHPAHELRIRELAAELLPELHVSTSFEAVGTFREYERFATTIADAALSPLLTGYLTRLVDRARGHGLPAPEVMLSNGGTVAAELAGRNASWTVLSGPAGGAVGAARAADRIGAPAALGFDMGGTSTDISVVADGAVKIAASREIAGRPIALAATDVSTVGAGGGSIAWRDSGGALRVGPQSAGARPGPACYGHGGSEPTVTDANLLLGYLAADSSLAGGLALDRGVAERALAALGERLGLSALETAAGVVEIANLEMLGATSAATVARGIDPRDHTLIAFGGAGPMHATAIAEALEIERVVCPAACGVLSAYGMAAAGRRRDRSRSLLTPLEDLDAGELAAATTELALAAAEDIGMPLDELAATATHELRYAGQSFELPIEGATTDLAEAFNALHEERYGFSDPSLPVELVTLRVSVATPGSEPPTGGTDVRPARRGERSMWFGGVEHTGTVLTGELSGEPVAGPAVIEQPQATVVVPPGWQARATGADVILDRQERR